MGQLTRRTFIRTGTVAGLATATLGGPLAAFAQDGDKPQVAVGSKNFTEQLIVGEMLGLLLEDSGFSIKKHMDLGGTIIAHEALVAGDLDTYIEYSGTGLLAVLGEELPDNSATSSATPNAGSAHDPAYEIVAREYPEKFNVKWLEPWGFNNTFAMVVSREFSDENNVTKISDIIDMASDMSFAASPEFVVRPDGLEGLEETYGFSFDTVQNVDIGLLYPTVADGTVDAAMGDATAGRIRALDLVSLEDDKNFFPPYYAAPIVRMDLLDAAPEIEEIFNRVAGKISNDQMQSMNYDVDEERMEPIDVARRFLEELELITPA